MRNSAAITRDAAEAVAIQALSFIAGEPERLGAFLAATGIGPEQLRQAARQEHFLAGILDHLAADQALLLDFAAQAGIDAKHVMAARAILGGHVWERDAP